MKKVEKISDSPVGPGPITPTGFARRPDWKPRLIIANLDMRSNDEILSPHTEL